MASLSGHARHDGPRRPVRDRRQVRATRTGRSIALVGDGAMQMNGLNELITVAKYWRRWSDPRLVVLVLNNRDLNQVTWEQRAMQGDPKYEASQELPDFPYARLRRADRAARDPGRRARMQVGDGLGRGARAPTARACSRP